MDLTVVVPNQAAAREYKKGNWTLQETMVLIEAKKMDDQRRMSKRLGDSGGGDRGKPTELRWKWVEDFCWNKGCLRSQNQCNDKWDNLMRDFKKVREYERRLVERGDHQQDRSYWRIEKNERKDNNLPSNMLPQIYEALVDVVDRKGQLATPGSAGAGSSSGNVAMPAALLEKFAAVEGLLGQQHLSPQGLRHHHPIVQAQTVVLPLPPPPVAASAADTPVLPSSQPQHTSDSDTREQTDSPSKRRKKRGISSSGGGDREATSGGGGGGGGIIGGEVIGSAISRSASIIAEAIQSGEERQERRHRELVRLQQRRLQIEESKAEINRQGVNGLVDAINKLANSIVTFASNATSSAQTPPK